MIHVHTLGNRHRSRQESSSLCGELPILFQFSRLTELINRARDINIVIILKTVREARHADSSHVEDLLGDGKMKGRETDRQRGRQTDRDREGDGQRRRGRQTDREKCLPPGRSGGKERGNSWNFSLKGRCSAGAQTT